MLSQIVIEAEAHGDSGTKLRLSSDNLLIAENLTAAQARLLIEEILDRIPVAEIGRRARRWSDNPQADAAGLRGRDRYWPSPVSAPAGGPRQEVLY
jgi:hypothetical protein